MTTTRPAEARPLNTIGRFGALLRHWRGVRHLSQLDLAMEAGVSTRHLSFVETGRAQPSRGMILHLADVLDVPLRERNALLDAAFRETSLSDPEMTDIRRVLEFILERHEPFGAVAMDRHWNIVMANRANQRLIAELVDPAPVWGDGPLNLMRLVFHPLGLRRVIVNWDEVCRSLLVRLRREVMELRDDAEAQRILQEILSFPGIAELRPDREAPAPSPLLIPVHFRTDRLDLRLFSTITSLGTAQDITLHELRIESFFPADSASDAALRAAAEAAAPPANGN